jgi:three-Cys-motif partner protein
MPKKEYGWEDGSIPEIAPHSLAKHRILREYVQRYLQVLTSVAPGMDVFRLTLVDGFAGGGEYIDARTKIVQPGSPLILLDAVRAAETMINAARSKPLRIEANYVFIEKKRGVVAYLREVLKKRGDSPTSDGNVALIEGEFEAHLEEVIARVKSRSRRASRAIFLLDQYGYTGVPVETLKRIFTELPKAEVFLTLAVGWITAYLPNASAAAAKLGIPADFLKKLAKADEDALDLTDPNRRPDLLTIQRLLHHAFTTEVGSSFYTPFFIVSRESNRPYWFLHMANSSRANDVVKNLHWEIENHFAHFGRPGLAMLGYDPNEDPEVTKQTAFDFSDAARVRTRTALMERFRADFTPPTGTVLGSRTSFRARATRLRRRRRCWVRSCETSVWRANWRSEAAMANVEPPRHFRMKTTSSGSRGRSCSRCVRDRTIRWTFSRPSFHPSASIRTSALWSKGAWSANAMCFGRGPTVSWIATGNSSPNSKRRSIRHSGSCTCTPRSASWASALTSRTPRPTFLRRETA